MGNIDDLNLEDHTIVVIEAPDFFKGRKLASTIGKCKWHDNAMECLLLDADVRIRKVCVSLNNPNDRIILLSDLNPTS